MNKWIKFLKAYDTHAIGSRVEVSEADAAWLIEKKIAELSENDPLEAAFEEHAKKFEAALDNVVKRATDAAVKAVSAGTSRIKLLGTRNDDPDFYGYIPDSPLGDFAMEVREACHPSSKMPDRLKSIYEKQASNVRGKAVTGANEGSGEEGGFLVPTQLGAGIYERVMSQENLLGRTDSYSLTSNSIEFNGLQDDNRATGSRWGGVRGYWLDEGDQYTGSKPKFHKIKLRLNKLGVLCYATDELIEDSVVAIDQFLNRVASSEIAFLTTDAIMNGDGISKPLGYLNSAALISVTRNTANKVKLPDIVGMWSKLWAPARSNAIWLINQEVEPELDVLEHLTKNVAGTENVGGWPIYWPQGMISDRPFSILKTRPVITVEQGAALGTLGDISLIDPRTYLSGIKGPVKSSMSIHLRFDYDETAFKFTFRVGGQPWWNKSLTPFKGTSGVKYSPFVALAA